MRCVPVAVSLLSLVVLTACKKEEITTYRIPKEQAPVATMPADHNHAGVAKGAAAPQTAPASGPSDRSSMANTAVATSSGSGLAWKGPAHWQEKPAAGMRKGSFTIPGEGGSAELAITAFPGDVGGEVANVNRWRQQINLPPLGPDEATQSIQRIEANGLKVGVVELVGSGTNPKRVLSAMVPHAGSTWFFKLEGPDVIVAKEKAAFLEFVKTIRPAA